MSIFLQVEEEQELRACKGDTSLCMWLSDSICPSSGFSSVSQQSDMSDNWMPKWLYVFFFLFASISFIFFRVESWKRRDRWRVHTTVWVRCQGRGRHAIIERARGRLHYKICWCVCGCVCGCMWQGGNTWWCYSPPEEDRELSVSAPPALSPPRPSPPSSQDDFSL